jgi:hypothetical protein
VCVDLGVNTEAASVRNTGALARLRWTKPSPPRLGVNAEATDGHTPALWPFTAKRTASPLRTPAGGVG